MQDLDHQQQDHDIVNETAIFFKLSFRAPCSGLRVQEGFPSRRRVKG